jgi:bifunctional DNase/RNase
MVEMRVRGLAVDAGSRQPVVILTDLSETRFLPIWIGVYESDAILLALENIQVPRPTSHDLMKAAIEALHGKLDRVVVHTLDEKTGTFYAKLLLLSEGAGEPVEVDARPSDAIALALRFKAPLFVSEAILSQPNVVKDKEKVNKDIEEFKKFLEDVKPADFERYDRSHGGGSGPDRPKPKDDDEGGKP